MIKTIKTPLMLCVLATIGYSEVSVVVEDSLNLGLYNNTSRMWNVGGVRFHNKGFQWSKTDHGYTSEIISNTPIGNMNEVEAVISSTGPGEEVKIGSDSLKSFKHVYTGTWQGPENGGLDLSFEPEVLLRTGAAGKVDDPIDAESITTAELAALIQTQDYYDSEYRYSYTDSLGVNGGLYSGGFLDTWHNNVADKDETQILLPIPKETFTVNDPGLTLDSAVTEGPMYWMSLAMAQEYFRVDMQWMLAMGMKEGNAGIIERDVVPNRVVYDGSYNHGAGLGAWHTEALTGADRAMTYANYFPKFEKRLSSIRDFGQFKSPAAKAEWEITDYYCGESTPIYSASIINTMVFSILVQYANYDVFAYATDVCWKESLASAVDPYMGLAAMLIVYNVGNTQIPMIAGHLNSNSYETAAANPNGRTLFGTGHLNYIPGILSAVQTFVDASNDSRTDPTIKNLDHAISRRELLNAYFGDNGTVDTQGDGGLLLHYFDPTMVGTADKRQEIWDTLNVAFDIAAGQAPSTLGTDSISYRYDLVSIFRTVKDYLPFNRNAPAGGDATNISIPRNSGNYPACGDLSELDEKYPYGEVVGQDYTTDFVVDIRGTDNISIKEVTWCIDSSWSNWTQADWKSTVSSGDQTFSITVPKQDITDTYGDATGTLWYMVTDGSGNSVVKSIKIKGSPLKSAEAYDLNGDGQTDEIRVTVTPGALEPTDIIGTPEQFNYSWPTQTTTVQVPAPQFSNDVFTFAPTDKNGAGLGTVEIKYPSLELASRDILDKVGPALTGVATFNNNLQPDTLFIPITEPLATPFSAPYDFLLFSSDSTIPGNSIEVTCDKFSLNSTLDTIIATLSTGTIENNSYKYVKLRSDGVADTVGNYPATNSQWVKIKTSGSETKFVSAHALDGTDGRGADGISDTVQVTLNVGTEDDANSTASIKSVNYRWNNSVLNAVPASIISIDNSSFKFAIDTANYKFGEGVGELTIEFNDGSSFSNKSIEDKTGPAIESAVRLYTNPLDAQKADTVIISISEELGSTFDPTIQYFSTKDPIFVTDEIAISVTVLDKDTIQIIYPFGTIAQDDSIAFFASNITTDIVGNIPDAKNQFVPIIITGGKEPALDGAAMYDANGDGKADSLVIKLRLGDHADHDVAADLSRPAKYIWPMPGTFVDWSTILTPDEKTVIFTEMNADSTAGTGKVKIDFPNGTVEGNVADKVGPVIIDAVLWENLSGGDETLQVTFSEDITAMPNEATISVENSSKNSPTADQVNLNPKKWIFTFAPNEVAVGDSVNIFAGSQLRDIPGNQAHPTNIKVIVREKQSKIAINKNECGYFDTNADGKMDLIKIKMIAPVTQERIKQFTGEFTWPSTAGLSTVNTISLSSNELSADGSDVITIDVSGKDIIDGMTYVDDAIFGQFTLSQPDDDFADLQTETITPKDKMAPILIDIAQYRGKHLTSDEDVFSDTLIVKYSEEIKSNDFGSGSESNIFDLQDMSNNGNQYDVTLIERSTINGSTASYVVQVTRGNSIIPATSDSIRVAGSGHIADNNGNNQNSTTPYIPFGVVVLPAEYEVIVYPNPFIIDVDSMNQVIDTYGDGIDGRGKLAVMVRPYGNRVGENLQGWITTFDAVGNVIDQNEKLTLMNSGVLLYSTDFKNSAGRAVGSGSYRSIITVKSGTGDDEQVNTIPVMIGIKKAIKAAE